MTYREALAKANAAYAVAFRARNGQLVPADEQIIIHTLLKNLQTATPDPPGPVVIPTPPTPPTAVARAA